MTVPTEEMLRAAFGAPAVEMPEVAAQTVVEANVPADGEPGERRVRPIPASQIPPRPVRWLWALRVALGTLCLLAGREGIGKSTLAYSIVAQITRGELPGVYAGEPRAVIVAATEDSWSHTIVPRLMAAGADLDLVFRADVTVSDGFDSQLVLPADLGELEASVSEVRAALILFDPLLSRLSPESGHAQGQRGAPGARTAGRLRRSLVIGGVSAHHPRHQGGRVRCPEPRHGVARLRGRWRVRTRSP